MVPLFGRTQAERPQIKYEIRPSCATRQRCDDSASSPFRIQSRTPMARTLRPGAKLREPHVCVTMGVNLTTVDSHRAIKRCATSTTRSDRALTHGPASTYSLRVIDCTPLALAVVCANTTLSRSSAHNIPTARPRRPATSSPRPHAFSGPGKPRRTRPPKHPPCGDRMPARIRANPPFALPEYPSGRAGNEQAGRALVLVGRMDAMDGDPMRPS